MKRGTIPKRRIVETEGISTNGDFRREFRQRTPWPKDLWFEDEKEIEPRSAVRLNREPTIISSGCSIGDTEEDGF